MLLEEKLDSLYNFIKSFKKVAIAFSGGVDSSLLCKICYDIHKENSIAFTIHSPLLPLIDYNSAIEIAKFIGIKHIIIQENNIEEEIEKNPINRCYFCKKIEFNKIIEYAKKFDCDVIFDGSNIDDISDYRPGLNAIKELNIRSPFIEANINKSEIRIISKNLGLKTWNKPSMACLASRIPYNEIITKEKLNMIDKAESYLRSKGFVTIRVRCHNNNLARIEVAPEERVRFFNIDFMNEVTKEFKKLGFMFVTLDLEGYSLGKLNLEIKNR